LVKYPDSIPESGSITTVLLLIAGIAVSTAGYATCGSTDGGTFKRTSGLMTDDGTGTRTDKRTSGGSALGVRAYGTGAIAESDRHNGADDGGDCGFHDALRLWM